MPRELSTELLAAVLARTLEEAAFVFLEPTDEERLPDGPIIEATIEYTSEHRAELRLAASQGFASTLAANMLGEEEGGEHVTGDDEDAMGELLNMVAGSIAAEVFGRYAPCTLGIPRIRRVAWEEHRRMVAGHASVTMADEEGRRVHLSSRRIGAAP